MNNFPKLSTDSFLAFFCLPHDIILSVTYIFALLKRFQRKNSSSQILFKFLAIVPEKKNLECLQ